MCAHHPDPEDDFSAWRASGRHLFPFGAFRGAPPTSASVRITARAFRGLVPAPSLPCRPPLLPPRSLAPGPRDGLADFSLQLCFSVYMGDRSHERMNMERYGTELLKQPCARLCFGPNRTHFRCGRSQLCVNNQKMIRSIISNVFLWQLFFLDLMATNFQAQNEPGSKGALFFLSWKHFYEQPKKS